MRESERECVCVGERDREQRDRETVYVVGPHLVQVYTALADKV